jgi:hypothetical protein
MKRILLAIVWCVVLYFLGCVLVGGIAGGLATANIRPGEDASAIGAAAGARVVGGNRPLIGAFAAALAILGSYFGFLPGLRVTPKQPTSPELPRNIQRWAKTRQLGQSKYIWLYGVVYWGLLTGILWSVIMAMLQGWDRWPMLLITGLIVFPIGGRFFGSTMWNKMEAKYNEAMVKMRVGKDE